MDALKDGKEVFLEGIGMHDVVATWTVVPSSRAFSSALSVGFCWEWAVPLLWVILSGPE